MDKCLELEAYKMAREQARKQVYTPPELREIEERVKQMDKSKLQKILKANRVSTEILNIEDENIDYLYGLVNSLRWVSENFDIEPNGAVIDDVIDYLELKI